MLSGDVVARDESRHGREVEDVDENWGGEKEEGESTKDVREARGSRGEAGGRAPYLVPIHRCLAMRLQQQTVTHVQSKLECANECASTQLVAAASASGERQRLISFCNCQT